MDLISFLEHFKTKYMENKELQVSLEETLFHIDSYETWYKSLIKRSEKTREIYLENEALIKELKSHLEEDIDDEKALAYFNALNEMYINECDDYAVMILFIEKILPFYEEKLNYGKLVKIYHMLAFEYYEAFGRTGKKEYIKQACLWYKKVISFKDHYKEIIDPEDRVYILIAYSNLVAPFGQMEDGTKDEIFEIYDSVLEFYKNEVEPLDGKDEDFIKHLTQIKEDIFFSGDDLDINDKYRLNRFISLVDNYDGDDLGIDGNYFRAKMKVDILRGILTKKEAIEKITSYIESLPMPNYSDKDAEFLILNYHNNAIELCDLLQDFKEDYINSYIKRVVKKLMNIYTNIPYGFCTQIMNNVCQEIYFQMHDIISNYKDKLKLLLKLILVRQPTTYIHSLMVAEIATLIAKEMIKEEPKLFLGPLEMDNIEMVLDNKNKIISYVETAGLLHDVGKCYIVEIVNRQNRKLSDLEFGLIKEHPSLGLKMIGRDNDFKDYFDIMLGHHKWYDDTKGYPIDFKKNESKYHFYIDLITISDCIDAATDILGRNYTSGKNFDTLFKELKNESGTRYNPKIVEFIGNNKKLYQALSDLTGKGRAKIYYMACQEIMEK